MANREGLQIQSSADNLIGGALPGARNVISGNTGVGVNINQLTATGNRVQGNFIGTDVTGTVAVGNGFGGVRISGGPSNSTIGGTSAGEGNVISGNTRHGVEIQGAAGNFIQGNFIGTDVTGTLDVGNSQRGVSIVAGAADNTIGGTTAGAGNVISGNNQESLRINNVGVFEAASITGFV